ncbi:MAG: type I restriction-modification system subunit M [Clostridia bacterium]|nr:type I restriction-modification system subunit M [Clostridia bacterium]
MENEISKQTTVNIQEKANLIWAIADKLVGTYKPHEYGNVILPMCVIKRFEDTLAPTKAAVLTKNKELDDKGIVVKDSFLREAAGQQFYNLSKFTFKTLLNDPENIKDNFESYLNHFSENVIDIIHHMDFDREIQKMAGNNILYLVISEFCTPKAYLGADVVTSVDMGYIFEEIVRKFSESYDEQAGAHFTARDIIYLMTDLLVGEDEEELKNQGIVADIYDMAMGTSQMLGCLTERFRQIDPNAEVASYGQEINDQTFAIAKADTLIKGGNANNMKRGDTLGNDQFATYKFDYIISNPPFGIEWKTSKDAVEAEHNLGEAGRFAPGLPSIGDGQMLFLLNGVAKLREEGRMAIIQNGSSLFKGDAGSGESEIRGYLLENDWLEAIVQLPSDLFYNTGIATYVWVITKSKNDNRIGKVQLIDASGCYEKRRKSLGNKRVEITDACRDLIMKAYRDFSDWEYESEDGQQRVESRVFDNDYFKFSKLFISRPLRLKYENLEMPAEDAGITKSSRALFEKIVKAYKDNFNGQAADDYEFFAMLKKQDIKISVGEIKAIRLWFGTKDPAFSEVHKKPLEKDGTDFEWDPDLADTEIIPWQEDIAEYLDKNVRPYAPDFVVDEKKTRIGYEIPFTREFYKYVAPRRSEDIFVHLKELGRQEAELMNKILG